MALPEPALAAARLAAFEAVQPRASWGETSFFVNPGGRLKSGAYFATLKEHDGPNDRASALDRPGVWRLAFGPGRAAYAARFGPMPARPARGGTIAGDWDFTALDCLTPHPVYGWMGWMAVNCPAERTLDALAPLLATAHARALDTARRRKA